MMTSVHVRDMLGNGFLNELHSKVNFDTVTEEKNKPEVVASGHEKNSKSMPDADKVDSLNDSTLAEASYLRKQDGAIMSIDFSDEGFVKLPRSLLTSESWRNLTFRHKGLFLYLLEKVQYKPKIYNHHGKDIPISPGQYCVTYRRLVEEYNQTLKFKKEHIDVPFLQRAVSLYDKFRWTDTRTDTGIMIITITYKELSIHFKSLIDTGSDTKTIQDRYTNEERKKERSIKETIDRAVAPDSSLFDKEKEEHKKPPSVFQPKNEVVLSDEKKKHFEILWKFIVQNKINHGMTVKPGIKEADVVAWLNKYEGKDIMECLKLTLKAEIKKTYGGYVSFLLKERIPKKEVDKVSGKKLVEEFIKKHKLNHIELKQDYFVDCISNEQSKYCLPDTTLNSILKRSMDRAKEREEEDRRQREYEENY